MTQVTVGTLVALAVLAQASPPKDVPHDGAPVMPPLHGEAMTFDPVRGRIVAFANLWPGGTHEELSVDLMRHRPGAPNGVMDALFANLMVWGRTQGYQWFVLGMAPLSGLEASAVAPLWARVGRLIATHGESLYNFRGLRAYKEKFDPVWDARYLAWRGGLALPRALADVSALIAGGYREVFRRS